MDHGPINTRFDGYYLLPVLCSSEMVRAHLDGMKFETRRPDTTAQYARAQDALRRGRKVFGWVREGWYATYEAERRAGPVRGYFDLTKEQRRVRAVRSCWYQADEELKSCEDRFTPEKRWVTGMHMPFRHHRLFMRIRSIECCQLGDVTEADALREGIAIVLGRASFGFAGTGCEIYRELWSRLYGAWSAEQAVWVIRYDRPQQGHVGDYIAIERAIERDLVA